MSEGNKNKIKQKNLITERADGHREFENVKYSTHGYLRVKKVEKPQTASFERKSFIKSKVRDAMNEKLNGFLTERYVKEKELLSKAKRKMLLKNTKYNQFGDDKYVLNDPLNKDVRFYAYLFMKKKEERKFQAIKTHHTLTKEERPKHFL